MPAAENTNKTARAVGQVMAALKNSSSPAGPTMTEIVKFISSSLHRPATKRQVITALKRGVEFGVLKRQKGRYLLSEPEEALAKAPAVLKKVKPPAKKTRLLEKVDKRARLPTRTQRLRGFSAIRQFRGDFPSPPTMSTILPSIKQE